MYAIKILRNIAREWVVSEINKAHQLKLYKNPGDRRYSLYRGQDRRQALRKHCFLQAVYLDMARSSRVCFQL